MMWLYVLEELIILDKFNKELLEGDFALGTVIPKHALDLR